jgi:hypothetical protein
LPSCGTTIIVTQLHESVREEFRSEIFASQLKEAIQSAHQQSVEQGISITLNKVPLKAPIAKLFQSGELKPAHQTFGFEEETDAPVSVKVYAGIADSDPQTAGWSVFCNGRLILEADGTLVTGWGEGNGRIIPRFHNQFARFRGYVFFDCDDAGKLPWNTTKTGVDSDSRTYQAVRQRMIEMMRPVIDFLNRLDAERDNEPGERFLTETVEKTRQYRLPKLSETPRFVAPEPPSKPKVKTPRTRRIQYDKPEVEIEEVKAALGVSTLKEVGEKTFEYFYELECE